MNTLTGYIALLLILSASAAATPGSTWLELGPGARASALGDAVTASADGAVANYWNPAAVGLYGNSVEAMYADSWIEGGTSQFVAGAFNLGRIGVGVSAQYVGFGDLELRDRPSAAPIGSFDSRNLALGGVVSMEILWGFRAGAGLRYLSEQIYVYDATGWAVDLGLLRRGLVDRHLDVGFAARHMGKIGALREEAGELPMTIATGARWTFDPIAEMRPALMLDISKVSGYDVNVHIAGEIDLLRYLTLRAGYLTGYDARGFAAGFGLTYKGIRFDFAYLPYSDDLGTETRYSVGGEW